MDSDIYMDLMTRDVRFGPKKGQIGTKWDKSGTFEDNFSVPICPNLAKSDIPEILNCGNTQDLL